MSPLLQNFTTVVASCAVASTQYNMLLPTGARSLRMQARTKSDEIWFAFASTPVTGSVKHTIRASQIVEMPDLYFGKATIFYGSPATGAILEILVGR